MSKVKTRTRKKARNGVPYARGFHPPTKRKRLEAAVRCPDERLPPEYLDEHFFEGIPRPDSIDDWLAQYNEEGQTYPQFLDECPWISSRKRKYMQSSTFDAKGSTLADRYADSKIYLLPLGDFEVERGAPSFQELAEYARAFYTLPVVVLPAVRLTVDRARRQVLWEDPPSLKEKLSSSNPKACRRSQRSPVNHLDARFHGNGQYQLQVGSVLMKLKQRIPLDGFCLMALTMSDLYDTTSDLFVAGMAAGNHRVGVFSLKRYDPTVTFASDNWYDITSGHVTDKEAQKTVVLQRSCKLLVHEIAHIFGLDHCIWYSCCMNGSGHLKEDFRQSMHLCPVDLRKLQTLIGFNVLERYRKLVEFFTKHQLETEKEWTAKRIAFLTKQ